jgi:hydrogenase/urease accessory protein HupE
MTPVLRVLLCIVLGIAAVGTCSAHPLLQNRMWILLSKESARVAVDVSVTELSVAQRLQAEPDGSVNPVVLTNAADFHGDYVLRHLRAEAGGVELAGKVTQVAAPPQAGQPENTYYQYELEYPLMGADPQTFRIAHTMLREFPYGPGQPWDITYTIRWKLAGDTHVRTSLLRMGGVGSLPEGAPSGAQTSAPSIVDQMSGPVEVNVLQTVHEYFWHGVIHILTGYDHLLFVAALLLATVTFWEMVKVILAFTLAHTLTLTLSVLGLVRLPDWVVEPVIAASIVFVALENLLFPKRIHSRLRLAVAFGFGLIHGLGFAGGLIEAMEGLPALGLGLSIVTFSLGVEVAHQLVVLPLWGVLRAGRAFWSPVADSRFLRFGSLAISAGGFYFLFHAVQEAI